VLTLVLACCERAEWPPGWMSGQDAVVASRASFAAAIVLAVLVAIFLMWPRLVASPPPVSVAPALPAPPAPSAPPAEVAPEEASPPPTSLPADPRSAALCPGGMVYVEGAYCPYVAHRCAAHLGVAGRDRRCDRYHDDLVCDGRPSRLAYCIDRHEYPNQPGMLPAILIDYREAERACAIEGKRLCEAEEWIFACEGPRTWPYPTGLTRDSACNVDRVPRQPSREALARPFDVSVEVARLDQRVPSGTSCASPFGVFDTTGNVAEWVHDREGKKHVAPFTTALAGGHWERALATCRALDRDHGARHRDHRSGFRCCRDALDGRPARRLMAKEARLPRRRKLLEEPSKQ
jgi:formylglycine-generating enzyme